MAVSESFYRNIFLLNQLIPPSNDFKKLFREGMFVKSNVIGFVHVSHYLLTTYDAERFEKLVEWPVTCKKTEAKYRNDVQNYLNVLSLENPDIGFPPILSIHLHRAGGTKFIIIMWKLSQLVLKKYITHKKNCEIVSVPKPGPTNDLFKAYVQQSKINITHNISSCHKKCLQMEKAVNLTLTEEKKELSKIKAELFDRKQSLIEYITVAPVAVSIKQRLANVEDSEIIQMWKSSLNQNMSYIQKQNEVLKNLEKICEKITSIITNLLSDTNDQQLEKINCTFITEFHFPSHIQHFFSYLYNDNKLIYYNFIHLFTSILHEIYEYLKRSNLMDLSPCLLQVEASTEDMRSIHNVFKILLTNIINSTEEIQSVSCEKNIKSICAENVLSLAKNVLLMPSPLIKINTNCANEKNDLYKLLQFTPREFKHKSLFSRYMRHNRKHLPELRTNLFESRINIDEKSLSIDKEEQKLNMHFVRPKVSQLCEKRMAKYSRLFSRINMNKNIKGNPCTISLPYTAQVNSTIANTTMEIPNLSDLNLDITTRSTFNFSEEFLTPVKCCTSLKQNISRNTFHQAKDLLNCECSVNKPKLEESVEMQFSNDEFQNTSKIKHENIVRRPSISDLIERYKKFL